ncbi:hypothetical protein RQP46_002762 [Phenoliferia psychrophenolica]
MASIVALIDQKGRPLIQRAYRDDIPPAALERFLPIVLEREEEGSYVDPCFTDNGISYLHIRRSNVFLVALTKRNVNAAEILCYLSKLVEVLTEYFSELEEESVRDNFVIIYELFDEMMDFGFPQATDGRILKEYITQESYKMDTTKSLIRPSMTITNAVSWRSEGVTYRKNEVFLDVVESVNLMVNATGKVVRSEIQGAIKMRCFLSGMPELRLGLNDKVMLETSGKSTRKKVVEMEDVKFHQVSSTSTPSFTTLPWHRTISFIPPDGEFDLMTYRISAEFKPLVWAEATVEEHSGSRLSYVVKVRSQYKRRSTANGLEVTIPVSDDASTPKFKAPVGTVTYHPEKSAFVWKFKQLGGGKDYTMRADFSLPSVRGEEVIKRIPITIKFEIPYFTVSGVQVRYLKVIEKSGYKALPWVRYITQNGDDYSLKTNQPGSKVTNEDDYWGSSYSHTMDSFDDVKEEGFRPGTSTYQRRGRFEVASNPSSFAPSSAWSNKDLDPAPPKDRVWSTGDYVVYWWSDALALATWELGSSMVAGGLDWRLAIVAVGMGQFITSFVITANGAIGARLHIPFPVLVRASFGFYWSYFAIVSRLVVGIFWLGITATSGGHFIYFLIQFPLLLMPWTKIKHVFALKSVVGLVVMLAIFGNTVYRAGGIATGTLIGSATPPTGSAKVWLFFGSMTSVMGGYSTFAVSVSDFSRYSRHRNTQWVSWITSPLSMTFIASLGIMTAASTTAVYGEVMWNPTHILDRWTSPGGRAAAAFCAIGLIFVQVGINIAANSIAAGNDFVSMAPKYINLARGQMLAAFIGCWVLCPWIVLARASSFLTFVSQYTIVLGPIAAVVVLDYWIVKKQKLNVPELYKPDGMYRYNKWGANWRAVVAVLVGSGPGWPGFIHAINPNIYVTTGAEHIIQLGYLYSFSLAGALYVGLSLLFPDPSVLISEEVTGEDTIALFDDDKPSI